MTGNSLKTWAIRSAFLFLAVTPAAATGDFMCAVDDSNLAFTLAAATNREHGTIVNVAEGSLRLKSKTLLKISQGFAGELKLDLENIIQQWFFDRELRIAVNIDNEHGELLLTLVGQANSSRQSYSGRYRLTVSNAGVNRTVTGRVKGCSADG